MGREPSLHDSMPSGAMQCQGSMQAYRLSKWSIGLVDTGRSDSGVHVE
jgi:hypothetical protein